MERRRFLGLAGAFVASGTWYGLDRWGDDLPKNALTRRFQSMPRVSWTNFLKDGKEGKISDIFVDEQKAYVDTHTGESYEVVIPPNEKIHELSEFNGANISYREQRSLPRQMHRGINRFILDYGPSGAVTLTGFVAAKEIAQELHLRKFRRNIHEDETRSVAYHEAGHALAKILRPGFYEIGKATIIPDHGYLGAVFNWNRAKFKSITHEECKNEIMMLMCGRAAEKIVQSGDFSIGATQDHKTAKGIAESMVSEWGMSEKVGPVNYGNVFHGLCSYWNRAFISNKKLHLMDEEVERILKEGEKAADKFLEENRDKLVLLAETLLVRKEMQPDEMRALVLTEDQAAPVTSPA